MLGEPQAQEDLKLLERVAARDEAALGMLLRRYAGALLRYLQAHSHDAAAAEDALQETTLSIWKSAGSFRGETTVRAWLYTIARHAMIKQKRGRSEPVDDGSLERLGADAGWGDERSGARIEKALGERMCIERAFARLSDEHREILLLVDGEELSLQETAEALGLSLSAVKSRLHRARLGVMGIIDKEVADAR